MVVVRVVVHLQQVADVCPGLPFLRLVDVHPFLGRLVLLAQQVYAQILPVQVQVHKHTVAAVVLAAENGPGQFESHVVRAQVPVGPQQHPVPVFPAVMQAEHIMLFLKTDAVGFLVALLGGGIAADAYPAFFRHHVFLIAVVNLDDGGDIFLFGQDRLAVFRDDMNAGVFLPFPGILRERAADGKHRQQQEAEKQSDYRSLHH